MENIIFVLDTSTSISAGAVYKNQNLLATLALHQPNVHSQKSAVLLQNLLQIAGFSLQDLTHLAFAAGPGSYTGLRIGISLLKGLAFGLNIPIIGYSTLWGRAAAFSQIAKSHNAVLVSSLDARKDEIYCTAFDWQGNIVQDFGIVKLPDANFNDFLKKKNAVFVGNHTSKIETNSINFNEITNPVLGLGDFFMKKIMENHYENLTNFEPKYLKEVHITQKKR